MEDNKLTEFEEQLLKVIENSCKESGIYEIPSSDILISKLRQIMPPTCTTNERKFLDLARHKILMGFASMFLRNWGVNESGEIIDISETVKELVE